MMAHTTQEFIIKGNTEDGKQFRPSDWAERLCGVMKCFEEDVDDENSHITFSQYVRPIQFEGVRSVAVNLELEALLPMAYNFFLDFAKSNNLQVIDPRLTATAI